MKMNMILQKVLSGVLLLSFAQEHSVLAALFADDFDSSTGSGDSGPWGQDGSESWSSKWSGNIDKGVYFFSNSTYCSNGSHCLQIEPSSVGRTSSSSKRGANLSGFSSSLKLTFDYHLVGSSGSPTKLHFKANGMAWAKMATIPIGGGGSMSVDIEPTFLAADFMLRFKTSAGTTLFVDNVEIKDSQTPGEMLDGSFADDFDTPSDASTGESGNDGTYMWADGWSQGPGIRIEPMNYYCLTGNCLRLLVSDNSYDTAVSDRGANLDGVTHASLSFHFQAFFVDGQGSVLVTGDGPTGPWVPIGPQLDDGGPNPEGYRNITIPPQFYTSNFRLRFMVQGYDWNDLYIDEVRIDVTSQGGGGPPLTPPPTSLPTTPYPTVKPTNPPTTTPPPSLLPQVNNYADNFDSGFNGNDGTLDWTGSWSGDWSVGVYVHAIAGWCKEGDCLRLFGGESYFEAVWSDRGADLEDAVSASLSFDSKALLQSSGVSEVQVSADGLTYSVLGVIGEPETSTTLTIPPDYFTSNFRLRFFASGYGRNDVFIDNVSIDTGMNFNPSGNPSTTSPTPMPIVAPGPQPTPAPTPTPAPSRPPTRSPTNPSAGSPGCGKSAAPGQRQVSIFSGGVARGYYLSVPANYDPYNSYDLVVGYHGIGWRGDWMRGYLQLEDTANADDTIFVYPDALVREWPMWGWIGSDAVEGWETGQRADNDDFVFFDDMLEDVSEDLCINLKRVYVTGQSWGGDMASALSCARGNKIAASVSVASNSPHFFNGYPGYFHLYPPIVPADCDRAVPMMTMKGQYDPRVSGTGYVSDWWFDINDCQHAAGSANKETITSVGTFTDVGCQKPNIFVQYSNSGTGKNDHQVPAAYPYYNATTMNFFGLHSLP